MCPQPNRRGRGRTGARAAVPALIGMSLLLAGCDDPEAADGAEGGREPNDLEELRDADLTRLAALVDADMKVLEALHAEDYRLVPPPGDDMSRDQYLDAVASGDLDFLVFEPVSDLEVVVSGDVAVVTYRSFIHVAAAGVGELAHDAWSTYRYERGAAGWELAWEQVTAVGGARRGPALLRRRLPGRGCGRAVGGPTGRRSDRVVALVSDLTGRAISFDQLTI